MVLMLWGALFSTVHALAEDDSGLRGGERQVYLDNLKRLYLTQNERQALLLHSNALLDTYALRAAYQVGQPQRQDLLYQLRLGEPGELVLREEIRSTQGVTQSVHNRRISLFGLDPFIAYECPPGGIRCILRSPGDGQPLLTILRDRNGAAELAKALSFLIRNLQKG
ncbi:hypothetical protein OU800_02640 [Pseudomonas sp. GOM7]|uniref:hypothetical protein n=1 Tax=unclassified Pseudomonas TaxID=196821 RepID=UPI00227D1A2C|nr:MULTISPECIES: hypothetical protein [unclassified Pseudomonas]WAJ38153.1 hypothetical protein OU800_02640 [Pseudomonas sp. GOM7]